ncbi:MAG: hypothetical protein AB7O32_05415 [Vicinamibacterales bacterium]
MALARAALETLLRARQLDRTLTTADPVPASDDEYAIGPTAVDTLDVRLGGGFPRGQLSEVIGARTSGRTSVLVRMLAAATRRGELAAVVDALDMLDVASLEAAGVVLERLLWIRGYVTTNPGGARERNQRAMEQALRALALVLQAGNFGLVVLDVAEAPVETVRRLPFTTWLRLQRMVEGTQTIALLVGGVPMARSAAGLTVKLEARSAAPAASRSVEQTDRGAGGAQLLPRLDVEGRIVRARMGGPDDTPARFTTEVHVHV